MKLRSVWTENGIAVEALKSGASNDWVRLANIEKLAEISERFSVKNNLQISMLSILELGHEGWKVLSEQVDTCVSTAEPEAILMLPFQPLSFRDFLLFEQHFIDATRGFVKRFLPKKYRMSKIYEALTGKVFPRFKPSPLWYRQPLYYLGNHLNFITSGDDIITPSYTRALDYELELGAILAKPLFNATASDAENAIGGYVVLNDLSARDVQMAEMRSGFGPQKAKHFMNVMSPIVITADEINERINDLQGAVIIDGVKRAHCTTASMQYSLAEAIAYASKDEQLYSGELFGSGTLPGGSGMENDHWLYPGSVLNLKIDDVGEMTNRVV
ncbi:MAG: fumarylacetoacetate hydrolase family protein [Legionella sp.]|nr:fumarylacetoacetate hydrolase family protein [Legionella sp.]